MKNFGQDVRKTWPLVSVIVMVGLLALTGLGYRWLDSLSRQQLVTSENMSDIYMAVRNNADSAHRLEKSLDDKNAALLKALEEQKNQFRKTVDARLQQQEDEIKNLRRSLEDKQTQIADAQNAISALQAKDANNAQQSQLALKGVENLMRMQTALPPPTAADSKPVAFATASAAGAPSFGPTFDGRGGRDIIKLNGGTFAIDGTQFVSLEDYKIDNDEANTIFLRAPGLNNLEDNSLEIEGDMRDTLFLDGCLKWLPQPAQDGKSRWIAKDTQGKTRNLAVSAVVKVIINTSCDNRYALLKTKFDLPRIWEEQKAQAAVPYHFPQPAFRPVSGFPPRRDPPLSPEARQIFDADPVLASMWREMLTAERQGKIPASLFTAQKDGKTYSPLGLDNAVLGAAVRLGEKGRLLKLTDGRTVIYLEPDWGEQKADAACTVPSDPLHAAPKTESFGGIGIKFDSWGERIVILEAIPGGPADKAGVHSGDQIMAVDGRQTTGLVKEDLFSVLRGMPDTNVVLHLKSTDGKERDVSLTRALITIPDGRIPAPDPRTPEANFLFFGAGISAAEIDTSSSGLIKNRRTGDVLLIPPCFNRIFHGQ